MKTEILVIDDNADIRFLICNILQENGYSIRSAANYDQAIKEINTNLPDIAIVDIKLDKGDKDGIDLLKLLVNKNKSLPVIMISGHANVQVAVEAIRIGAYEFVEKPFSSEKLLNYVKRALEVTSIKKDVEKGRTLPEIIDFLLTDKPLKESSHRSKLELILASRGFNKMFHKKYNSRWKIQGTRYLHIDKKNSDVRILT